MNSIALPRRTAALAGAVVLGASLLTAGAVVGVGTAEAATPPTISVTLWGAIGWKLDWDGTPAASCDLILNNVVVVGGLPNKGPSAGSLPNGTHRVAVECGGKRSNTLYAYAPRSPLNDMRTQFSNSTQGMFGS